MSKPPPFKRDSIDMGRHGRVWKYVKASELKKGDIVKDLGLVAVGSWPIPEEGFTQWTTVGFVSGYEEDYLLDEEVFAFVRVDNG